MALGGAALTMLAGVAGTALAAQREDPQVAVGRTPKVVFNDSFVSRLVEVFGDVRVGRKVFVAGNTVVRADPGHRVCIGSETNLQDNIVFLALSAGRVPRAPCGRRSTSTEERVSIAHQAEIVNSRIGSFTPSSATWSWRTARSSCTGRCCATCESRAIGSCRSAP